jgi:hypothetical protein
MQLQNLKSVDVSYCRFEDDNLEALAMAPESLVDLNLSGIKVRRRGSKEWGVGSGEEGIGRREEGGGRREEGRGRREEGGGRREEGGREGGGRREEGGGRRRKKGGGSRRGSVEEDPRTHVHQISTSGFIRSMSHFLQAPNLKILNISDCERITNECLKVLVGNAKKGAEMKLEALNISKCIVWSSPSPFSSLLLPSPFSSFFCVPLSSHSPPPPSSFVPSNNKLE